MQDKRTVAIVCGGRDFNDFSLLSGVLDQAREQLNLGTIIQGEARGADLLAKRWAEKNKLEVISVPAKWEIYGKKAGYLRNVEMADLNPQYVIAFPGGRGTQMMIDIARKREIKVFDLAHLLSI